MKRVSKKDEAIFYCLPNVKDGLRYTPKALNEYVEYLYYGKFGYFFKILNILSLKKTILLNSFRFCDRCIAHVGLRLGCRVIIIQHGRNEYFKLKRPLLIIKKFFLAPRYSYELLFLCVLCVWFSVVRLKTKKTNSYCNLLYFTNDYRRLWISYLSNTSTRIVDTKVSVPNPISWGAITQIPRIRYLPVFLIDEPLDSTIGMSNTRYFELIDDLILNLNVDKIYTKRHPRSDNDKFKNNLKIVEIDEVPENVEVLIGYESNLLYCGINCDKFYKFDSNELRIESTKDLQKNQKGKSYSDLNKEDFLCG